ncbi:MAG: ParB/RepB/Spo0J family partition protein [Candidatus Eremiobacteraeota bacterium]|nr:ParB/RepB/Spo0J family partition protein [Candidatus Eremiobacteraeota bacterium]MBV8354996.1 ParB/RepB/Spo0J family partition protein [Candidatus Eremiobacteraeota bacterium]
MTAPKRGLGRGLGALLGDDAPLVAAERTRGVIEIPVDLIAPSLRQPRMTFDAEAQEDLRASIGAFGVLVPILVRRRGERYELIAGERRWRAASAAGLRTIPALVREADDRESLEVALVENLQREDLDPLEEAMGYQHLIDDYGLTQEAVAERVGRSRPAVANALRLLVLTEPIQALIRSRALSAGHARALLAFPEKERLGIARRAVRGGLSVRALERLAQRATAPRKAARVTAGADLEAVAQRLRYRLGTQISFVSSGVGGRIEIRYVDDADLKRLIDILLDEA